MVKIKRKLKVRYFLIFFIFFLLRLSTVILVASDLNDEFLLKFVTNTSIEKQKNRLEKLLNLHFKEDDIGGFYRVQLKDSKKFKKALKLLSQDPNVSDVQSQVIYQVATVPTGSSFIESWALQNTGQTLTSSTNGPGLVIPMQGTAGFDLGMTKVWNYVTDCRSIKIAILDTGIQYNHQDLKNNLWLPSSYPQGVDFVFNQNHALDLHGHGTLVAGVMGAIGSNTSGSAGLCWQASLMPLRVLDAAGESTTIRLIQGIDFAIRHQAQVIHLGVSGLSYDAALWYTLNRASEAGILIVVPAGNHAQIHDGTSQPTYPCDYHLKNLVCVAAIDALGDLADFSDYGVSSVHLGAPGVNIFGPTAGVLKMYNEAQDPLWMDSTSWTLSHVQQGVAATQDWSFKNLMYHPQTLAVSPSTGGLSRPSIVLPSTYPSGLSDLISLDSRVFRSVDLTATGMPSVALLSFDLASELVEHDQLNVGCLNLAIDPFSQSSLMLGSFSGSTQSFFKLMNYDISRCIGSHTTLGIQLISDPEVRSAAEGVALAGFQIRTLEYQNNQYTVDHGTSLASAHVAGVAALLMSFHSKYQTQDVIESLLQGVKTLSSLEGKVKTAGTLNAFQALTYIQKPKDVVAVIQ